jgi:hypothetical protein
MPLGQFAIGATDVVLTGILRYAKGLVGIVQPVHPFGPLPQP